VLGGGRLHVGAGRDGGRGRRVSGRHPRPHPGPGLDDLGRAAARLEPVRRVVVAERDVHPGLQP